jgi:hypothetical protein
LLLLGLIAHSRAPEYDEAYSIFLTAGDARPAWPSGIFTPGSVRAFYTGYASLGGISRELKTGDVHPPLYFWGLELWRGLFGASWFTARLLSVIFSLGSLSLIAWLAEAAEIPVFEALGIALLSYGFAYTGIVARNFALAQFLNLLGFLLVFQGTRQNDRRLALCGGMALGAASFRITSLFSLAAPCCSGCAWGGNAGAFSFPQPLAWLRFFRWIPVIFWRSTGRARRNSRRFHPFTP